MKTNCRKRDVHFFVQDGCLVRTVTGEALVGRTYTHRCSQASFEIVAHALGETPDEGDGTTLEIISRQENLAFTQVNVALEFLKERGLVDVRHRRCYPATSDVYLDAMVEWHALREERRGASAPRCQRCGATGLPLMMSRFNTQMICLACEEREKAHPLYATAAQAELDAVRRGDMNFPGVGKPNDL